MYVKVNNGVVEKASYSIGQLRKDNPQTSFPKNPSLEMLAEWNVYPLQSTPAPSVDHTKNIKEGAPINKNGKWIQTWEIVNATQEEISQRASDKAAEVRSERNQKLAESDWTQIADAPVDKNSWLQYRQELRDISKQQGFPMAVNWPLKPN